MRFEGRKVEASLDPMGGCLWCGQTEFEPSIEHILPEALGCPPDFVLKNSVCKQCNNGLAHIDQALLKQFEVMTFIKGVRRKKRRKPSIDSWPALRGRHGENGPELMLNAGPGRVDAWGKSLVPAHNSNGISDAKLDINGIVGTVTFSQSFGDDPKFIRGLYKVAVSALAYWHGSAYVRDERFEAVRRYVLTGEGLFGVILFPSQEVTGHKFRPPFSDRRNTVLGLAFTIFGIEFIVDLLPEQNGLRRLHSELVMQGARQWTRLPLTARI
jgi:hypothetical protein